MFFVSIRGTPGIYEITYPRGDSLADSVLALIHRAEIRNLNIIWPSLRAYASGSDR